MHSNPSYILDVCGKQILELVVERCSVFVVNWGVYKVKFIKSNEIEKRSIRLIIVRIFVTDDYFFK